MRLWCSAVQHHLHGRLLILPRCQGLEALPRVPQFFQGLSTYTGVWVKKLHPRGSKHCVKIGISSPEGCAVKRLMQNWRTCSRHLPVLLKFVHQTITHKELVHPLSQFSLACFPIKTEVIMTKEAVETV